MKISEIQIQDVQNALNEDANLKLYLEEACEVLHLSIQYDGDFIFDLLNDDVFSAYGDHTVSVLGFSTAEGRIQGHVDGIIYKFPVELEAVDTSGTLWECKTMNNKNWNETAKYGVFATKFIYFVQVQIYMAYLDLKQCLFTALNKDTSELFLEIVPFDLETAQRYSDRAVNILKACDNQEIFPRLSADKNFFKCKMCSYREECWK